MRVQSLMYVRFANSPLEEEKKTFLIPAFGFIADTRAPDKPGEKNLKGCIQHVYIIQVKPMRKIVSE